MQSPLPRLLLADTDRHSTWSYRQTSTWSYRQTLYPDMMRPWLTDRISYLRNELTLKRALAILRVLVPYTCCSPPLTAFCQGFRPTASYWEPPCPQRAIKREFYFSHIGSGSLQWTRQTVSLVMPESLPCSCSVCLSVHGIVNLLINSLVPSNLSQCHPDTPRPRTNLRIARDEWSTFILILIVFWLCSLTENVNDWWPAKWGHSTDALSLHISLHTYCFVGS